MRTFSTVVAAAEKGVVVAQTEAIPYSVHPSYMKHFRFLVEPGRVRPFEFCVYDSRNPKRLKRKHLLAKAAIDLPSTLASSGKFVSIQLEHPDSSSVNTVYGESRTMMEIKATVVGLPVRNLVPHVPPMPHVGMILQRGGWVKTWERRYGVLKQGVLSYYEQESDYPQRSAKGTVLIKRSKV